jgi:hypothetical protein
MSDGQRESRRKDRNQFLATCISFRTWAIHILKNAVFWEMVPCRSWLQPPTHAGFSIADFSTLKMGAIHSSETSVYTRSTRPHIPEDDILHSHRLDNLRSYIFTFYPKRHPGTELSISAVAMSNFSSTIWRRHCNRKIQTNIKLLIMEIQFLGFEHTYSRNYTCSWVRASRLGRYLYSVHCRGKTLREHKPEFRIKGKVVPFA